MALDAGTRLGPYDILGPLRWSPDGKQIYFPGDQRDDNDMWSVTIDGHERRMTRLSQRAGSVDPFALAADRKYLYFAWRNDLGDIWVMDVMSPDNE
jgi:Tol biopolymer transport system component